MPNYGKTRAWSRRYLFSLSFYFDSTEHTYPCPRTKGKALFHAYTPCLLFLCCLSAAHSLSHTLFRLSLFHCRLSLFVLFLKNYNTQQCVLPYTHQPPSLQTIKAIHANTTRTILHPLLPHNFFYRRTNMPLLTSNGSSPSLAFCKQLGNLLTPLEYRSSSYSHWSISTFLTPLLISPFLPTYLSSHPPPSPQPALYTCACTPTWIKSFFAVCCSIHWRHRLLVLLSHFVCLC